MKSKVMKLLFYIISVLQCLFLEFHLFFYTFVTFFSFLVIYAFSYFTQVLRVLPVLFLVFHSCFFVANQYFILILNRDIKIIGFLSLSMVGKPTLQYSHHVDIQVHTHPFESFQYQEAFTCKCSVLILAIQFFKNRQS